MDVVAESLGGDCIYRHHEAVYNLVTKHKQPVNHGRYCWPLPLHTDGRNKALTATISDCFNKNRMVLLHCEDSRASIRLLSCLRCHSDPEAAHHCLIVTFFLPVIRFISQTLYCIHHGLSAVVLFPQNPSDCSSLWGGNDRLSLNFRNNYESNSVNAA